MTRIKLAMRFLTTLKKLNLVPIRKYDQPSFMPYREVDAMKIVQIIEELNGEVQKD